jgi:hypothetical protein
LGENQKDVGINESIDLETDSDTFEDNYLNLLKTEEAIIISNRGDGYFKMNYNDTKNKGINKMFAEHFIELDDYCMKALGNKKR